MKFNEIIDKKNYFITLNEAINFRSQLWGNSNVIIEKFTQDLYDELDIEECIFIINDFFDKNIYSLDKVDLLIKLNNNKFEELAENKIMSKYESDNINFHFMVEDKFYLYNNSFFKKENLTLNMIKSYNE